MTKRAVEKNRMFTALAASVGRGEGAGRCAKEARRERNRAMARGIKIGAKKMANVLILNGVVSEANGRRIHTGKQSIRIKCPHL
jgi:hypothetical protein